jgi:hypothetical protein
MKSHVLAIVLLIGATVLVGCGGSSKPKKATTAPQPTSAPAQRPCPYVAPSKPNEPTPPPTPPGPWVPLAASVEAKVGGTVSPDGAEALQIQLPGRFHLRNRGGSDGAGLCVFASMRHTGVWQSDPAFTAIFEWMFTHPGGGTPPKVDAVLKRLCQEKGYPMPDYFHVEGWDPEILKLACANNLLPGVTYSRSPTGRYGGQRIAHMVSLPHFTDRWAVVLDNNHPGENAYEWMSPEDFHRVCNPGDSLWVIILVKKGPPAPPKNKGAK